MLNTEYQELLVYSICSKSMQPFIDYTLGSSSLFRELPFSSFTLTSNCFQVMPLKKISKNNYNYIEPKYKLLPTL